MSNLTDRELLEWAAKAACYEIQGQVDQMVAQPDHRKGGMVFANSQGGSSLWNPLTDDGDAFRLAGLLMIDCEFIKNAAGSREFCYVERYAEHNGDRLSSARKAIVRAAAAIGQAMKEQP